MDVQSYQYQPLGDNEIRLMRLSRREDGAPAFRLSHEVLDHALEFEAVSYTWGSEIRESAIRHAEGDQVIWVTTNCEETLRSLYNLENKLFWMDAICIDQDSVNERNAQVKLMGQIFRKAKRTIAYVGEPDSVSLELKDRLEEIEQQTFSYPDLMWPFLRRPWFKRTWVIQEVLLTRDLVVRVGDENLDTKKLMTWSHSISSHTVLTLKADFAKERAESDAPKRQSPGEHLCGESPAISSLLTEYHLMNWGDLFDFMCASRHYNCSDPRDKVFALVSLFNGDVAKDLEPDYSINTVTLYTNISRFLLCYGVARTLAAAHGISWQQDLPTWAVDWRQLKPYQIAHNETCWYRGDPSFRAGSLENGRRVLVKSVGKDVLRIRGFRLATVVECPQHPFAVYRSQWLMDSTGRNSDTRKTNETSAKDGHSSYRTRSTTNYDDDRDDNRSEGEPQTRRSPCGTRELLARRALQVTVSKLACQRGWNAFAEAKDLNDKSTGYLPRQAMVDDCVCILLGFRTPFVLRPFPSGWKLVGECYVHGVMEGEAMGDIDVASVDSEEPVAPLEDFLLY